MKGINGINGIIIGGEDHLMAGKFKIDMSALDRGLDRMIGTIICDENGVEVNRITEHDIEKTEKRG
mgnify:CR=1 FL=1